MVGAILLFIVFLVIYIFIIEIFTVLFRLTGLTNDKARFQVISMLTNSGFTTVESEAITVSKERRNLAKITILFGYSFSVIIVSLLVNFFMELSKKENNSLVGSVLLFSSLATLIILITKLKRFKTWFDDKIQLICSKFMFNSNKNTIMIMDYFDDKIMATVRLNLLPEILKDNELEKSGLKNEHGVQVLILRRNSLTKEITKDTILKQNDVIVVFGNEKKIKKVFTEI